MRVIGLTGGIGSGKSTVATMFQELGAEVVDADRLAREVVEPGQPALEEIRQAFGDSVIDGHGRLDRARLGSIVFKDEASRQRLNAITHPRIQRRMREEVRARAGRPGLLLLDIPLLFESKRRLDVEAVVLVWVDPATQLRRLTGRGGLSLEQAERRIAAQMPLGDKRQLADHVIDNSGSMESTRRQVTELYRALDRGSRT